MIFRSFIVNKKLFKNFPVLYKNIQGGVVIKYTSFESYELNIEDRKIISELEEKYQKYNLKVICVLSSKLSFGKASLVDIDDYIFISKECKPEVVDNNLLIYAESYNRTCKVTEIGYLEITEENGIVQRVCL